jgi:hypothetical protein
MKRSVIVILLGMLGLSGWLAAQNIVGTWSAPQWQLVVTFNEDGTYIWQHSQKRLEGTYTVYESMLYMDFQDDTALYEVTLEGDTLILKDDSGNEVRFSRVSGARTAAAAPGGDARLPGEWAAPQYGLRMSLQPDGGYTFASSRGRWRADAERITFTDADTGSPTVYEYRFVGDTLKFRDSRGNIIDFERQGAPAGRGTASPAAPSGYTGRLVGTWRARNVDLEVVFAADGTYRFGSDQGRYKADETRLRFTSDRSGNTTAYDYRFVGEELQLRDPNGNVITFARQ